MTYVERRRLAVCSVTLFAGLILLLWTGSGSSFALSSGQTVKIGEVNGSEYDLQTGGFTGIRDFTWVVGVDYDWSKFPANLASASTFAYWNGHGGTVVTARIIFDTDSTVKNVVIDVTRGGSETLVMDFDGTPHGYVAESVGSHEREHTCCAELRIAKVTTGRHILVLSLLDDGLGNGTCFIDGVKIRAY